MALLVPDVGEVRLLSYAVNKLTPENFTLKLYQNNITPGESDVAGTYTEATFTGYAATTLTGANFTVSTVTGTTTATYSPNQVFTSTANQTTQLIYGYFVVGASSGILMWAEKFTDGPYAISVNGDSITITVKITAD